MKAWTERINFAEPLRDLRLVTAESQQNETALAAQLKARYDQGVRDGEKALREQLVQQRNEILELQRGLLQSLGQSVAQVRSECEASLVQLAMEVAQKLVSGLPVSTEMIEAAIREALGHVEANHDLVVWLHAEDLAMLQRLNSPVLLEMVAGEKIRFQASPEVTRGGCLVQTRFGVLDARRETKFELLKKALQN